MFEQVLAWLRNLLGMAANNVLSAGMVLVIGLLVIRVVMKLVIRTLEKSKLEKAAHTLILSLSRVVLYVLLCLAAASALGIDVTGIVALASVLTLAVSLALQNALTNVIGGFTLLSTHPFRSGDYVEIAGQSGSVKEIGLSYTKLTTPDNKLVSIPNSAVVSAEIVNYTVNGSRRAEIKVSASYDAPIEQVLEALLAAADLETVKKDPAPFAAIDVYGEHAISYVLRFWSDNGVYWDNYHAINKRIKKIFDERGIRMTYPHLNIHVEK